MTLLERVESRTLTGLLALPTRVQRLLAGRRRVHDGQTLAPDVQLMLRLMRLTREPGLGDGTIEQGRALLRRQARLVGGRPAVAAVQVLEVAGRPARLYVPRDAGREGPLLLFLHGGGYVLGDLGTHDAACRFLARGSGVRVLSFDYRLAPEHPFPAAHDDCVAAFRWVVEHAAEVGADPARLGVGGDSAGGALSAAVAVAAAREGLPLAFQLLVYPGADMRGGTASREAYAEGLVLDSAFMDLATESYVPDVAQRTDPRASPLLAEVPPGLAPAYVATAGFDPLRDEGEALARRLAEAGVPVELRRFPDQVHGFLQMAGALRSSAAAVHELADALARGLGTDRGSG